VHVKSLGIRGGSGAASCVAAAAVADGGVSSLPPQPLTPIASVTAMRMAGIRRIEMGPRSWITVRCRSLDDPNTRVAGLPHTVALSHRPKGGSRVRAGSALDVGTTRPGAGLFAATHRGQAVDRARQGRQGPARRPG